MTRLRDDDGTISMEAEMGLTRRNLEDMLDRIFGFKEDGPNEVGGYYSIVVEDSLGIWRIGPDMRGEPVFWSKIEEAAAHHRQGDLKEWIETELAIHLIKGNET